MSDEIRADVFTETQWTAGRRSRARRELQRTQLRQRIHELRAAIDEPCPSAGMQRAMPWVSGLPRAVFEDLWLVRRVTNRRELVVVQAALAELEAK